MKARGKWIGPLLLTTTRQPAESRRLDGCTSTTVERDLSGRESERRRLANGYAIRVRGELAIVIAWRARRSYCPRTPSEAMRWRWRHLLWVLRGRPAIAPMGAAEVRPRGSA